MNTDLNIYSEVLGNNNTINLRINPFKTPLAYNQAVEYYAKDMPLDEAINRVNSETFEMEVYFNENNGTLELIQVESVQESSIYSITNGNYKETLVDDTFENINLFKMFVTKSVGYNGTVDLLHNKLFITINEIKYIVDSININKLICLNLETEEEVSFDFVDVIEFIPLFKNKVTNF